MNWISVEDRLPTEDKLYLVCVPTYGKPFVNTAWYDPNKKMWSLMVRQFLDSISHWMELPEPPKEES